MCNFYTPWIFTILLKIRNLGLGYLFKRKTNVEKNLSKESSDWTLGSCRMSENFDFEL